MLKFYQCYYHVFKNDILISKNEAGKILCDESQIPEDKEFILNWKNLENWYRLHGLGCPFTLFNTRKGRVLSFFDFKFFNKNTWDIKEWKSDLNLLIIQTYKEFIPPSIDYVLKWSETDKAIQYINERKIKI